MAGHEKVLGYIFEPAQGGPLTQRLGCVWLKRVIEKNGEMERQDMCIFTSVEKTSLLNVQEEIWKGSNYQEETSPTVDLEITATQINEQTQDW